MAERKPRETLTREKEERRKPWAPPNRLQMPPCPPGYVQKWIRISMRGEEDKTNVYTKFREGWSPVRADEYPPGSYPEIVEGPYTGMIGQGGLMACRLPKETAKERTDYYGLKTREQMTAVDSDLMKEQHPSMPISNNRQSRVTFGGRPSE